MKVFADFSTATTATSASVSTDLFVDQQANRHEGRKSLRRLVRRFSAMSIWFSRSPRSVVSACSIFQLKFSISASSCACWYSNWKQQQRIYKSFVHYGFVPFACSTTAQRFRLSWGVAIAECICVCLPSCRPRFKSQPHLLRFFIYSQICAIFVFEL